MTDKAEHAAEFDPATWDALCDQLKAVGRKVAANAPDAGLDLTEGYRYIARLACTALGQFIEQPSVTRPGASAKTARIGADNPDFLYSNVAVSGRLTYRIHGNRGEARDIGFGSYYGGLGSPQGLQCSGYVLLSELTVDADGNFDFIASTEQLTKQQPGSWLPMNAETNAFIIRQTLLDRRNDTPATINIDVVDGAQHVPPPAPLDAQSFERSLQAVGKFVNGVFDQFIGWTNSFKARLNQIHPIDPALSALSKGDPNTRYHYGYFDLADDEGLLVELTLPQCEYWNLQVANYWMESLDFMDYQTHINIANAHVDEDGKVRAVIAKHDPGVANWIDTAGHDKGCIALRWVKPDADSLAQTRVVKLADLHPH